MHCVDAPLQSSGSLASGLLIHPVLHAKQFKNHPLKPHISSGSSMGGITRSAAHIFQYGLVGASRKKWTA